LGKEYLVRSQSFIFAVISALILSIPAAAASLVYDFTTPQADAALSGSPTAVYSPNGIPLAIQAGLMEGDGLFHPGAANAVLSVILTPPSEFHPGVGLGVLSQVPSGSAPEDGLSSEEGLVFHFSSLFEPTRIHLSGITLGGPGGGGAFEAVRVFADGEFLLDRKGEPDGTLTIALPPGISTLAVMPLLNETPEIPSLSSDPVFYVAAIEGEALGVGVAFDLRPGSCENPLNIKSKGVLPAAILGTPTLNVSTIDPASIRLAGVAPIRWSIEDVGRPGDCDAGPDGIPDLVLKFDTQKVVRALQASMGTLRDRQRIIVPLEGRLKNGMLFVGEDVARLQVPGKGKGKR
jgi:hypothetical protein